MPHMILRISTLQSTSHTVQRFLWALFNLGRRGKPLSPDYLAEDFGATSAPAQLGVQTLYKAIVATKDPKARVFFSQWKVLFGEACGYDVDKPSEKLKQLAKSYGLPLTKLRPAELFFALHTYYAIFMKLLASEIVAFFHGLPTPLSKMASASNTAQLKRQVEELEAGSVFRHLNITNFLEGDLFAWYVATWDNSIASLVRELVSKLDNYNPGTLSEDPAESRDLLKKLYQHLFPKTVRHDLGEYYTPDWLAAHVIHDAGYAGDPRKRLLDPACGSGTFLVMAINAIKKWHEADRRKSGLDKADLCKTILNNVIGFDLNPLAVMAARTNYLIAIRELISDKDEIEIPIYLCDSIVTPSEYGGLFSGRLGDAREIRTAAAQFLIPTEVALNRGDVSRYVGLLDFCVRNHYSSKEFLRRCRDEGLTISTDPIHITLYDQLLSLERAGKNGIWARIIKNAFAPLFVGKVHYIVGNPPWVNWRNLPEDYRAAMAPLWEKYDLFAHKGLRARLGAGMDDISVLLTYVAADTYLEDEGCLAFVITQTLFQSAGGGQGFRSLKLPGNRYLKLSHVVDFSAIQPFEGATNRTATFFATKNTKATTYPVSYFKAPALDYEATFNEVAKLTPLIKEEEYEASPIAADKTSPWMVLHAGVLNHIRPILGNSEFSPRIGAHSGGAAGVFWVDIEKSLKDTYLISNRWDTGKNKYDSVTAAVEKELVHPLIRGRDVRRWSVTPSAHIVLPYDEQNGGKAISESRLRAEYPKTYEYFLRFRDKLLSRPHYVQHFKDLGAPYWSLYNVGDYSFWPSRLVWREQSSSFQCAVVPKSGSQIPIADAKLIVVPCDSDDEAYYLAGLLNASPARYLIDSFSIKVQTSTHVLRYLKASRYVKSNSTQYQLAQQAKLCHSLAAKGKPDELSEAEKSLDKLAAKFWSITAKGLDAIQSHLTELEPEDLSDEEHDAQLDVERS